MALKNNYEDLDTLSEGVYYRCEGANTVQLMACADLEDETDLTLVREHLLPDSVGLVYSDPPWDPGNRKYWRTQADADHDGDYDSFLDPWCSVVGECIQRGASHVFTEQSYNDAPRQLFLDAVARCEAWTLPLSDQFKVFYGSPGSRSRQNPNMLLHFSETPLATDPSGLDGEPMTIRACAGIDTPVGSWVIDPCIGKGMTSRMALYYQWNCLGTEINPKRLGKTITWLERHEFDVERRTLDAGTDGMHDTPDPGQSDALHEDDQQTQQTLTETFDAEPATGGDSDD